MSAIVVRRTWRQLCVGALAAAMMCGSALAAERFVAGRGVDAGNDCLNSASPCASIGHALGQAASGDTVNIAAGRYVENLRVDSSIDLTVLGGWDASFGARDPAENPTIIRAGRVRLACCKGRWRDRVWAVYAEAGDVITLTIDGVTLVGGKTSTSIPTSEFLFNQRIPNGGGLAAVAAEGGSLTLTVRDVRITKNRARFGGGGMTAHVVDGGTLDVTLDRVLVSRNRAADGGGIAAGTIGEPGGAVLTLRLRNCIVARNRAGNRFSLDVPQAFGGGGMFVQSLTAPDSSVVVEILNSTITGNRARVSDYVTPIGGGGMSFVSDAGDTMSVLITNTIVWGNRVNRGELGRDLALNGAGSLVLQAEHNDLGDTVVFAGALDDLGGNVGLDPVLGGPRVDFGLTAASPLIDAGTCTGAPRIDFSGDARPTGAGCDIGADEFVP